MSTTRDALLRDASPDDAEAIAAIGIEAVPAQYAGLIDPAVIAAAVSQTYAPSAIADCIERCRVAEDASFLVAERSHQVVGFLHFDAFGSEPELHRLYLDRRHRGLGVGSLLMDGLHERVPADLAYMLLVVAGNDGAVRFYQRHGLRVERTVDGLEYYGERMGVVFPADAPPVRMILMRRVLSTAEGGNGHAKGVRPVQLDHATRRKLVVAGGSNEANGTWSVAG